MATPLFFQKDNVFYNVNQIVKFQTVGVNHQITMSNGDYVEINKGRLKLEEIIYVANPPYGEGYIDAPKLR